MYQRHDSSNAFGDSPQTAYWKGIGPLTEGQLLVAQVKYNGSDAPTFSRPNVTEPVQVLEVRILVEREH